MTTDATVSDPRLDRLFALLPAIIRDNDAYAGRPLQALLQVMAQQAHLVEDDIARLLDNWFIETCDDWVLPYIGELIGYRFVPENVLPTPDDTARGRARLAAILPRREVADTIRSRRRKGALYLLEEIAVEAAGWPARAVELRHQVVKTWSARFRELSAGRSLNVRDADAIDRANGPFNTLARTPDFRRIGSTLTIGHGNIPSVALWAWRLKSHRVKLGQCRSAGRVHCESQHLEKFYFHPAGIDEPLFVDPQPLPKPHDSAAETEVPGPIRIEAFRAWPDGYYGKSKSLYLEWSLDLDPDTDPLSEPSQGPLDMSRIDITDLKHWEKSLPRKHDLLDPDSCKLWAAVDPQRGRVLLRRPYIDYDVVLWARHHVGFSADIGGGSYFRPDSPEPDGVVHWLVRSAPPSKEEPPRTDHKCYSSLQKALDAWKQLAVSPPANQQHGSSVRNVVITIDDDAIHRIGTGDHATCHTELNAYDRLEIRAARYRRPVISPASRQHDHFWKIKRTGTDHEAPSQSGTFILDGLLVTDFTIVLDGPFAHFGLRHCTLFAEKEGCDKALDLDHLTGCVAIQQSIIVGSIHIDSKQRPPGMICHTTPPAPPAAFLPVVIHVTDSIIDGSECDEDMAIAGTMHHQRHHPPAYANLYISRSTVQGDVRVHTLERAENSIFLGSLQIENISRGCIRYCSLSPDDVLPGSDPTPPRYLCQPDIAIRQTKEDNPAATSEELSELSKTAAASVQPRFTSQEYGHPAYFQLSRDCPAAIVRGADDESEMGVFHDLYNPQREALLRARLNEYTPAAADSALFFAT
jgi:hypothetical protein